MSELDKTLQELGRELANIADDWIEESDGRPVSVQAVAIAISELRGIADAAEKALAQATR